LVYVAGAAAAATGEVPAAVGYMVVFGLGTLPMMLTIALAGGSLQGPLRQKLQKAIPVGLGLVATLLIVRGLGLGIPYLSPDLTATGGGLLPCH
jgi:sulfite exporter TauE/SafE